MIALNDDGARREARPAPAWMAWVEGGTFQMGSDRRYPEEAPAHRVRVDGSVLPIPAPPFEGRVGLNGHARTTLRRAWY